MAQQTFNVSESPRVEIRQCHNRVTVIGWDDAQRVAIDSAARQEGETIVVESADRVMVRVPRRAAVHIADCEADVRVEDLEGRVELAHIGGDGDVALNNVKSFQAEEIEGNVGVNDVETVSVDKIEGETVAKRVKSLKGAGTWNGDTVLREVESAEIDAVEGDMTCSEVSRATIQSVEGDLTAFAVRDSLALAQVKGDVNLRSISANVALDRVHGDFIASDVHGHLRAMDIEGDAVISVAELAPIDLRADGDVVLNLPENVNADIELDAPHGSLVARADIQATEEDETHVRGRLGNGGTKIRAESTKGDLILRAGGTGPHAHVHVNVKEFAGMGERIAREVRESMRESMRESRRGFRFVAPQVKIKKHWRRHHFADDHEPDQENRAAEKPRGPAAGSPERRAILDAVARGELSVDDAIKKLRGEG